MNTNNRKINVGIFSTIEYVTGFIIAVTLTLFMCGSMEEVFERLKNDYLLLCLTFLLFSGSWFLVLNTISFIAAYLKNTLKENEKHANQKTTSSCAIILLTVAIVIFIAGNTWAELYYDTGNIVLVTVFGSIIIWSALAYLLVFLEVSIRKKLRPQRFRIFARVLFIFSILHLANIQFQNYCKAQSQKIDQVIDRHENSGSYQPSQLAQLSKSNYNKPPKEVSNQQQEAAVELYAEGLRFIWSEDYKNALDCFEKAAEIFPQNEKIWSDIGLCYKKLGQYQKSVEAYNQAIRINPDYAGAYYGIGYSYCELNHYQEAIEAYKRYIHIEPDDADAYYFLGSVYGKLGQHQEALEAYKQCIRIEPDDAVAYYFLGSVYSKLDLNQEAFKACKQSVRINPDFAVAHYALGVISLIMGDNGSALEEYKILKSLDVEHANDLFNIIYPK